VSQSP